MFQFQIVTIRPNPGSGAVFLRQALRFLFFLTLAFARLAKLAYAQTVAMLMGSRSLPKNNEIVSATAYEKPPPPPPEGGGVKFG